MLGFGSGGAPGVPAEVVVDSPAASSSTSDALSGRVRCGRPAVAPDVVPGALVGFAFGFGLAFVVAGGFVEGSLPLGDEAVVAETGLAPASWPPWWPVPPWPSSREPS